MPDIFLSYNRNDQAVARRFAEGFEREGFTVWWDQTLRSGEAYDKVTEKALEDAKAVVVLWSRTSVDSRWVRAEATQADRNGTLVPVMIEACKRPIMFELTHTADLIGWKGDPGNLAWQAYVADVRQFVQKDASAPRASGPTVDRKQWFTRQQIVISLAALMLVGAIAFWAFNRMSGDHAGAAATAAVPKSAVTLAVLPFANVDGSEPGHVLAVGVAESVRHQLANLGGLSVISWSSSHEIDGEAQDIRAIAKRLGVAYVLQGSVQRQGEVLRITSNLLEAATERSIWSLQSNQDQKDVFSIQDEIATQVTRALSVSVTEEGRERMRGQGTHNVEAYLAFLEGQDALSTWRTEEAGKAAMNFNRALQLDPQFARAMVMLTRARLRDAEYSSVADLRTQVQQSRSEARTLIERALIVDPKLSEAYVERADLRVFEDPQAAEKDYRKAIELAPSNARAHQQLAALLWEDPARRAEAAAFLDRARTLDPLDPDHDVTLAIYLFYGFSKSEEADLLLRRVLERDPKYTPALSRHGEILLFGLGRTADGIRVLEKALAIDPGLETARRFLVGGYVAIGDLEKARQVAEDANATPVCRLIVAMGEHHVTEAARLAYAAFRDDIVPGADQAIAVEAINLDARQRKDYAQAAAVLEEVLNIVWISPTEPELGPNRGLAGDVLVYAGMLRAAGDEKRAQALLRVVEQHMDKEEANKGGVNRWNLSSRARAAAMKGDSAVALTILEEMCATSMCWESIELDPLFVPLRSDRRFKVLAEEFQRRRAEARKALQSR
jgi:TolB-like protein/Tfp pilus assembly protein PilF